MKPFQTRIQERIKSHTTHLVVGLDPHWHQLPSKIREESNLKRQAEGLTDFLKNIVDAAHEHACAFKPQIAFFERLGPQGLNILCNILKHIQTLNVPVIMDAKRNDIGSTAKAYAETFCGDKAPLSSDAVTLNGYLGEDGISPFLEHGCGIFVLVKTSNPSSADLQDLTLKDGRRVCEAMADLVHKWNQPTVTEQGYGQVGAVIGATYPEHMKALRSRLPNSFLLVPGFGAQGGSDDAIRAAFLQGSGALINSSRAICFPENFSKDGFMAISEAAIRSKNHIESLAQATR